MKQYIIWYTLQFKAWARRKTSWMQVLGMILLVVLTAQVQLPDAENTRVGVCSAPDEYAGRVLERLRAGDSIELSMSGIPGKCALRAVQSVSFSIFDLAICHRDHEVSDPARA